jgi:hypothetical protein
MKTACLIDVEKNEIRLEGGNEAKRLIIDFLIVGKKNQKYSLQDLSFGYVLYKDNKELEQNSWPVPGIKFGQMAPGIITSTDIKLQIETDYKLYTWFFRDGKKFSAAREFNSERPPKLLNSMVWNESLEEWEMLKPYPKGKGFHFWNEEKLEWEKPEERNRGTYEN